MPKKEEQQKNGRQNFKKQRGKKKTIFIKRKKFLALL